MPLDFQSCDGPVGSDSLFDWADRTDQIADQLRQTKRHAAQARYFSGLHAEDQVARIYVSRGAKELERRWRGKSGEVDLIFCLGDEVVFVEVKTSKTHDRAAARLTQRQLARVCNAAAEYLDGMPKGGLTPMRVDAALVDQLGQTEILENVLLMG